MSATTAAKKPPPPGRANTQTTPGAPSRSPSRTSTPAASTNGVARTRSIRSGNGTPLSARASVKKPGAPSGLSQTASTASQDGADEEAREETAALIYELKERLQKAESASEEYQKQIEVLHARLDDAVKDQARLEERVHEEEERVEGLENGKRESIRQHREFEAIYEAERTASMKDKEDAQSREEALHETVQRLKEAVAMKDLRSGEGEEGRLSRASSFRSNSRNSSSHHLESSGQFAPPASLQRSNSKNNSKLIHQKDKVIEGLRLELAEVQIKLVEMENQGGGRMQELERTLLETRMTNARLMEDNESFQLLLSEKTLNGDFTRDFMRPAATEERAPSRNGPSTSLADELESADGAEADAIRRLESEVNSAKDQNKALTLYINKIIERLLQHQGFESILNNTDLESDTGAGAINTNKELPPPPPPKEEGPSLLQRAKSVAIGAGRTRPRPASHMPPPSAPTVTEDPMTAPSIPLQRSQSYRMSSGSYHRRSNSDWGNSAASVVNNMHRAPPPVSGQISPGIASPRNSFFGFPVATPQNQNAAAAARIPSGPQSRASIDESRASNNTLDNISNADSGINIDTPSPPRSVASSFDRQAGGVMTGNKMRPLRLVQETAEEEEAQRQKLKANRTSWIGGWFNKGASPGDENVGNPNQ
ncbi:hypothetical protein BU16DRAFT_392099 [Lophium mytilinum]|uniref:M protein, serotype 2.1 n=1 Tax=Lophium mytilinum TaxID=390894 RepID=A0A6A6QTM7_9PEZI|nr:hypothetical protein BU16DRAFT_392099 [Lophium mytilinum]